MNLAFLFNPTLLIFLGILLLVSSLFYFYIEYKVREQNHTIQSMLSLVSSMAEEINMVKSKLQPSGGGAPASRYLPNNNKEYTNQLITVSDDEDEENGNVDSDEEIEDSDDEESDTDSEDDSHNSDGDKLEEFVEVDEMTNVVDDVKVLNISNDFFKQNSEPLSIIDESEDEASNIEDLDDEEESVDSFDKLETTELEQLNDDTINEVDKTNDNLEIVNNFEDITASLKAININNLEQTDNEDNDFKKMPLNKLRSIVVEKGIVADSSKMKKPCE